MNRKERNSEIQRILGKENVPIEIGECLFVLEFYILIRKKVEIKIDLFKNIPSEFIQAYPQLAIAEYLKTTTAFSVAQSYLSQNKEEWNQ